MTVPLIRITEGETVRLMRLSGGRYLNLSFGPSGAWLARDAAGLVISAWVLPLLAEWRGETFAEGGGI